MLPDDELIMKATESLASKRSSLREAEIAAHTETIYGNSKGVTPIENRDSVLTSRAEMVKKLSEVMSHAWAHNLIAKQDVALSRIPDPAAMNLSALTPESIARTQSHRPYSLADAQMVKKFAQSSLMAMSDDLFQKFMRDGLLPSAQVATVSGGQ